MELEKGMVFYNIKGLKCHLVNLFKDEFGDDQKESIVTYRYWVVSIRRWIYVTEFEELFLIQFNYGAKWI